MSMEIEDFKIMRKTKTKEKLVMVICLMDVRGILREKTKLISLVNVNEQLLRGTESSKSSQSNGALPV